MSLKAYIVSDSDNEILVANMTELEAKDAKIKVLEDEVSELKAQVKTLSNELSKAERKVYSGLGDWFQEIALDYQELLFNLKRKFMNNNNFDAIIEDLRAEYAELINEYDSLMFDYERLKLKVKMLEVKNRDLKAKLNKSENTQELVYDGLGDK